MNHIVTERYNEGKRFLLNESICFIDINEALIHSYSLNKIENELRRRFPEIISIELHRNSPYADAIKSDVTDGKFVGSFEIKLSSVKDIYKLKDDIESYYGWHASVLKINHHLLMDMGNGFEIYTPGQEGTTLREVLFLTSGTNRNISLFVEANFTEKTKDIDNMYHLTNTKVIDKIKRQGLNPRSHGNFPDRVYFGNDINHIFWMVGRSGISTEGDIPEKTLLKLNTKNYKKEILEKYTFYKDPRDKTAVYTYDVIDPKYLLVCVDDINQYLMQDANVDNEILDKLNFIKL